MINLTINNKHVSVPEGTTILKAAETIGIKIPALCHCDDLKPWGSCGICAVKNITPRGAKMIRACSTEVTEGMNIITTDAEIIKARRTVLELILSSHPDDCLQCARNHRCDLQEIASTMSLRRAGFPKIPKNLPVDDSYGEIVLNRTKCINCGRCVTACQEMQGVFALEYNGRGDKTVIGPVAGVDLSHSPCIRCGQCAVHCPVDAITFKNPVKVIFDRLSDKNLTTVAAIAPSVRAALGEEFGMEPGSITTGKIYTALRELGFKYVFDTNFAADLTIMEEGTELLERLKNGGKIPLFTSCCPGWVDYCEKNFHDMLPHLSTAKSPQQMQGAVTKTYFAQKMGLKPEEIFSVSIMPCTAKLWESRRNKSMASSGAQDNDMVLTTRELAMLIRESGLDFANLPEGKCDSLLGEYTGAGTIFGATGGVMEAALRTAYFVLTNKELGPVEYTPVRGLENVKSAEVDINGTKVRVAVVHQIKYVNAVVEQVRKDLAEGKEPTWHFIEVMACRGGCVGGGGQPYGVTDELRKKRAAALYGDDEKSTIRQSHNNPEIKKIYDEFFEKPLSEKSEKYLHTSYEEREPYRYE